MINKIELTHVLPLGAAECPSNSNVLTDHCSFSCITPDVGLSFF